MVGQVLHHGQRFAVRPVHVLQHQDGAAFGGQPAQNPQRRLGEHTGGGGTAGNAGPAAQCGTTVPSAER
jgi:hypothetical protein